MDQCELVQVPASFRKKKNGIFSGDHQCGASHGVSGDKVSEYGLRKIENSIVGV